MNGRCFITRCHSMKSALAKIRWPWTSLRCGTSNAHAGDIPRTAKSRSRRIFIRMRRSLNSVLPTRIELRSFSHPDPLDVTHLFTHYQSLGGVESLLRRHAERDGLSGLNSEVFAFF